MDEQVARKVVLVQTIENTDDERQLLSDDDRMYASRSAMAAAQWDASDHQSEVTPALFLHQRAQQILQKIAERHPGFSPFIASRNWANGIGIALPLLAVVCGALLDRITDPHRVDLLSAPLLLIILWNLLVVAVSLIRLVMPASRKRRIGTGLLGRLTSSSILAPRKLPNKLAAALSSFGVAWVELSAPLTSARLNRMFHFSAAGFALGAVISLYLRGMFSQYLAGWESTFLNAEQVHAILATLFTPAIAVFQLPGFSIAQVKALQFAQSASPSGGALWVHLYAGSLFLLAILPRLLLALTAAWKEYRLAKNFPIDLRQPYFRNLTANIGSTGPVLLRVFPYSFAIDELRDKNLNAVARMLLGEQARVMLRPSTAYGQEPQDALQGATLDDTGMPLSVVLFNLSATPEKENHGAFLDHLQRGTARGISVLIDESAYLERVGAQAGGEARVRERIALWQQFCESHDVGATIVNLLSPQTRKDDIDRFLAASGRAP